MMKSYRDRLTNLEHAWREERKMMSEERREERKMVAANLQKTIDSFNRAVPMELLEKIDKEKRLLKEEYEKCLKKANEKAKIAEARAEKAEEQIRQLERQIAEQKAEGQKAEV